MYIQYVYKPLLQLQTQLPHQLNALRQGPHSGIDRIPLCLEPLRLLEQRRQRHGEALDKLVVLELRLRVLVLQEGHVDADVDHVEVCVAEAGVC